tara:strand:+ start:2698 stop:2997 length:300 start_codon:yes stop_codon:yes gene_type:complete
MNVKLDKMERGDTIVKKLNGIDTRLNAVEETLKTILDKGDAMEESLTEKLGDLADDLQKQHLTVKRMQNKLANRFTPTTLLMVVLSSVVLCMIVFRIII